MLAAWCIGVLVAEIIHPLSSSVYLYGIGAGLRGGLLALLFTLVVYPILMASPAFFTSASGAVVSMVVVYVVAIEGWTFWLRKTIVGANFAYLWTIVGLLVIGLPIAYASLRHTAKRLHRLSLQMDWGKGQKWWRLRQHH